MAKLKASDIKVGGLYKIKSDQWAAYGYANGDVVTVTHYQKGQNPTIKHHENAVAQQIGIYISALDFYQQTKTQLEKAIDEARIIIADAENKLKWMKDTGNEEFDEDEYKVWHTLQILAKKGVTDIEKAKAIAALIKK